MTFACIFVMFIEIEHPCTPELYNACKHKVLSLDVLKYPGANINNAVDFAREIIVLMLSGDAWDSAHDNKLC